MTTPREPPEYLDGFRLVEADPFTGTAEYMKYDQAAGTLTLRRIQYGFDDFISHNRHRLEVNDSKGWGDGQVAASIPLGLYHDLGFAEARANKDTKWIHDKLNDSDYSKFRTKSGNL